MVVSRYQEQLKELYKLKPDDCLQNIAKVLKDILNCQTVCILLWNEGKQKLITEYRSGLPRELIRPEEYSLNEGLTGKVIFADGRSVNCLINMEARRILDIPTGRHLQDSTTKWDNMDAYAQSSIHGFKSLLGAPFYLRDQKLGAVKLINKLNGKGGAKEDGFDPGDLETLSYFLDAIEYVVGIKRYEKQVESLLGIGQKIISAGFNYDDTLNAIAARCADAMNYRICLIRILKDNNLELRASNVKPLVPEASETRHGPSLKAIEHRAALKFIEDGESLSELCLEGAESAKRIKLPKINRDYLKFLQHYSIRSFLIVPINDGSTVIGTIECYNSLARDFSITELNTLRMYIDALVISTLKAREQSLLRNLIEMHRIDAITEDQGEEGRIIRSVLEHTKALLGRRLKVLSVIFLEERLKKSGLKSDRLYGSREKVLKSVLGKKRFDQIFGKPNDLQTHPPTTIEVMRGNPSKSRRHALDIITVDISPEPEAPALGLLLLGLENVEGSDDFPTQVAQMAANSLAVMLANVQEFRRSKILINMVDIVASKETLNEIYRFILDETTDFFGFDFGLITEVDYRVRRVKTVMCHSSKPDLVDPDQWKALAQYEWTDDDILIDVFHKKKPDTIPALRPGEVRDKRLNEVIFTQFNHQDLARIWVPFVFRKEAETTRNVGESGSDGDLVLGIIEAGYHRVTQDHIPQHKQDAFVRFINSCANSLQRSALLEERKSIDDVVKRFNERKPDEDPDEILRKLLEDSVKLVNADSGDITFLTHRDENVRFLRDSIVYNIPELGTLVKDLPVSESGEGGIVGYVAATGQPYWSNDVKNNPIYKEEFPEVQSELVVPLQFSGQTFGILNINSHKKDWFDGRKASLVQTVAGQGAIFYQNARVLWPLYRLVSPFTPFATPEEIYKQVIRIIEDFLETETVSVWRKHADRDTFKLELVAASKELWTKYQEAGNTELTAESFTGLAASGKVPQVQVSHQEMQDNARFVDKEFARENRLRSMTAVPIQVGDEIYGAIDVFSRRDTTLFDEEVVILRIIASKAAIALQSAMLIESFSKIVQTAPDDDITTILERIAENALETLHADPVILFRYDASAEQGQHFDPQAIKKGVLYHKDVRIITNENDMANIVLERDQPIYLHNEAEYLQFERESKREWHSDKYSEDFWHRERIAALAALKLEHGGEVVGVMFINYREPQRFLEPTKRLIKVFASQAASAIHNAKIAAENKQFWDMRRADSLSINVSEIVYSLAHNQGNLLDQVNFSWSELETLLEQKPKDLHEKLVAEVQKMKEPLTGLVDGFLRLKEYRKVDELTKKPEDINRLTQRSVDMITHSLEKRGIKIDARYGQKLPAVNCDKNQMQHVLLNLFLNARDAMPHGGKLSIATSLNPHTHKVEIRVSDNGLGISVENRKRIFDADFSTKPKKIGSGFGLPISKYIVEQHGGTIELGASGPYKGATFTIVLPPID